MKNKPAFTLIETIIAITLITVVMTAVTGLILTTLLANERNTHTLQANFLAQEGLEAVRFMRDSNWLQNYSWDQGDWGQDFDLDSTHTSITLYLDTKGCTEPSPCFALSTDSAEGSIVLDNGFEFVRTLTFTGVRNEDETVAQDAVTVTANVAWIERGETRSVELSTTLTDWQ